MSSAHTACGCGAVHGADTAPSCSHRWSRRGLLRSGAALTAGLAAGWGAEFAWPTSALAQTQMTPDAALQTLMDGNKRFTQRQMTSFNDDLKVRKEHPAQAQGPLATVWPCAAPRA